MYALETYYAQNAVLWHEHTPRDVCATRSLRHRWHFVPSNARPPSDAASVHRRLHWMWLKSSQTIKFIWLIMSTIWQNGDSVLDMSEFCHSVCSQGSVATRCRCGGWWKITRVSWQIAAEYQRKNFKNRSTFIKVMNEIQVAHFFMAHSV